MLKLVWATAFWFCRHEFIIFIYMFWRGIIVSWQPVEVPDSAGMQRHSHSEPEVHTCSEGVCVTAFAWVETNNLHSDYTCFYVQEFFKRYIALGRTFFSCFSSPSQFCEMDTGKLSPHTSRPASSSAFLLILCILTRPTTAFTTAVVNSTHGFGAVQ